MEELIKIDHLLSDLDNYNCMSEESHANVVSQVNKILGCAYFKEFGELAMEAPIPSDERVRRAIEFVRHVLDDTRNDDFYKELLEAYQNNEQEELKRMIPILFPKTTVCKSRVSNTIHHGIYVDEDTSPEKYVDLAVRILQEGLLPSPHGRHHSMDENVRPVYSVVDPRETHGVLLVSFEPKKHGYAVFAPPIDEERLVYTLNLKVPMKLSLKSRKRFYRGCLEGFVHEDGVKFRDDVEKEMVRRRIQFGKVD